MKNILIISTEYPFGKGESYLAPELEFAKGEANIFLLPISVSDTSVEHRPLPEGIKLITPQKAKFSKPLMMIKTLFSKQMLAGIFELFGAKIFSFSAIKELFKFVYASKVHYITLKNSFSFSESTIIYSYWMSSLALTATYFKKDGCIAVCRAHGADLYDHRTPFNHQFLRKYLIKKLDYVFPVSEDGVKHLLQKAKKAENIKVMHLATIDDGCAAYTKDNEFLIVSCAYAVKLKRIDLIIEALSKTNFKNIRWVHFGAGPEFEKLKDLAYEKLKNIKFELRGNTPNALVKEFYRTNNVSLFINVSSTEGVPVSIMEALSFGIPALATDVGGVSELITSKYNGFLISPDSSAEDICENIEYVLNMNDEDYLWLRNNARESFLNLWESEKQYKIFYDFLNNI